MAEYSSWKVTDLKAELKKRGIPQTGLRLKQQFIDKLEEEDAKGQPEDSAAAPTEEAPEPEAQEEAAPETTDQPEQPEPENRQPEVPEAAPAPEQQPPGPENGAAEAQSEGNSTEDVSRDVPEVVTTQAPAEEQGSKEVAPSEVTAPTAEPEEPEEQAPTITDEPLLLEPTTTTEVAPSVTQTSGANTGLSTPLPVEEVLEDKRKRKRRSQSPVPTPEGIAQKKARAQEDSPHVILNEDVPAGTDPKDFAREERPAAETPKDEPAAPAKQDARFRGLFAVAPAPARPTSPMRDVAMEDVSVESAIHPATRSLYIDGLMRPLQPNGLRKHLITLASTPGAPVAAEVVKEFWLDPIKTHCFVQFDDIASASRVRSAIHGTVWPNERNRKSLWADFIPDERVKEWIHTEEAARDRPGPPVRWEVLYESKDDETTAILAEAGSTSRSGPSTKLEPGFNRTPPSGPRGSVAQPDRRASNAPPAPPSRPGQGFKPLDDLFESTTTKPKLYFLRVPREVADKRLDQFDELIRKGQFPRRGGDDMRRITFEDEDRFVDGGPEYGLGARQGRRGRGNGRGGGGGRGGDGRRR
ncbi:SAP domain protein [Penicillium brasilianum]|uniref:SAP domain protein n=1 Tax=Penicillium brasilianum TaxID=104259 RepID=A0A1S9S0B4_PENBI|nr:SAP domain protein [Penicillium brasilianum]